MIGSALFAAQKLQLSSAGDLTIDAAKAVENKQVNEYSIKGYSGTETNKENGSVTAKAGIKFTDTHTDTHSVGLNGSILTGKTPSCLPTQTLPSAAAKSTAKSPSTFPQPMMSILLHPKAATL